MTTDNKDKKSIISYKSQKNIIKTNKTNNKFSPQQAIEEFEQLKNIALNCYDKNGNPNIVAAIRAVENKAKIAGLYSGSNFEIGAVVKMGEITIDGKQLKFNIGEEFIK